MSSLEARIRGLEARAAAMPLPSKFNLSRLTTPELLELRGIRVKIDNGEELTAAERARADELMAGAGAE